MTFAELRQEMRRRFPKLDADRITAYINYARQELDATEWWPYLEVNISDPAPLELDDLGVVVTVQDVNRDPLVPSDVRWLVNEFGSLSADGWPQYYYVQSPAGVPTIRTYPVNTDEITVRYMKVSTDVSASTDTPLAPPQFHRIILDMAARDAYRDSD